ncbi:LOW QUALITY PROTEIN: protein enabled homolog [Cygnus olor]|uniref:LOW QUALITY PROTEIN: protein enabled homolog n=1 Tax=Cygnus olor TaxID=8869 RepID=UPI001ADEB491|nr:LOW QUALITY PROTEIN: protein enabled homolog [Cygnus olor]
MEGGRGVQRPPPCPTATGPGSPQPCRAPRCPPLPPELTPPLDFSFHPLRSLDRGWGYGARARARVQAGLWVRVWGTPSPPLTPPSCSPSPSRALRLAHVGLCSLGGGGLPPTLRRLLAAPPQLWWPDPSFSLLTATDPLHGDRAGWEKTSPLPPWGAAGTDPDPCPPPPPHTHPPPGRCWPRWRGCRACTGTPGTAWTGWASWGLRGNPMEEEQGYRDLGGG